MIRVLLAEDQAIVRAGFRALLDAEPDLKVAGEAANGYQAVQLARELQPDLVLMDIRMPELDGLEATRQITTDRTLNDTRVLVLTTFELDEYVFRALRSGASGFLGKGVGPDELLDAIRLVARGDSLLSPLATRALITTFLDRPERSDVASSDRLQVLTPREREVLPLLVNGLLNKQAAFELGITEYTVQIHRGHIMRKMEADSFATLVKLAARLKLEPAGAPDRNT